FRQCLVGPGVVAGDRSDTGSEPVYPPERPARAGCGNTEQYCQLRSRHTGTALHCFPEWQRLPDRERTLKRALVSGEPDYSGRWILPVRLKITCPASK